LFKFGSIYVINLLAEVTSWNNMKTRANSYNRLMPSMIRQKAGCGRMKGPSRNWIMEKRRKAAMAAYTPLNDVSID
jgi:hypothetical protein